MEGRVEGGRRGERAGGRQPASSAEGMRRGLDKSKSAGFALVVSPCAIWIIHTHGEGQLAERCGDGVVRRGGDRNQCQERITWRDKGKQ